MRRSGRSTSVDCRRIAEAAWSGEIASLIVSDLWIGDEVAVELLMDDLVRDLPSDVADIVYSASMGRDVRLTRFEPGSVLVFSCDEPDESARIDGEQWAMFTDGDGLTVVVTAGRGVKPYREGSAVAA